MEDGGSLLSAFNMVDIVAGAYLVWGLVRGLRRGLSRELARLLTMFVAVGAGWKLYAPVGEKINEITRLTAEGSALMGFALTLLVAGGAMVGLRWILRNLAEFKFKGWLERGGGAFAGMLRCALVAGAVITLCSLCPIGFISRAFGENSVLGSAITTYLLPAYAALAEDHPELDLPVPGEGGTSAGVEGEGEETGSEERGAREEEGTSAGVEGEGEGTSSEEQGARGEEDEGHE